MRVSSIDATLEIKTGYGCCKEFVALIAERYALCEEYYKLKDDVKNVEVLRRGAENIMSADAPEREPKRVQDISL